MIIRMMKDIVDEYHGIDTEQKHREEREEQKQKEQEYKENNFVPVWAKRSALAIAIAYILISVLMFIGAYHDKSILRGLLTAFLLICCLVGAGMMNVKNKQIQKYGCIIFAVFLLIQGALSFR